MHRVYTKTSPPFFNGSIKRISHLHSTRSSTLNFSKFTLKLTKTKYRISIRGLAIWNEKTPFVKVKMKSKLLNFDNEITPNMVKSSVK